MASELVKASVNSTWTDIVGAAAGQAGVYWQNVGSLPLFLSFTTASPGASDGYVVLSPGLSFHDDTGSAHVWAKCSSGVSTLTATLDPAAGGGGGGGGAVTVADGADVAEGSTAAAAYSDVTGAAAGTLVGLNKGQFVLTAARTGSLTETAPATDTASSGLNGRLQRIAQRLTSLIALLPASLGAKTGAASLSVVSNSDTPFPVIVGGAAYTDRSIADLSGSSQQLMAANANRKILVVSNEGATAIALNLTGGTAALNTAGSVTLLAGGNLILDTNCSTAAISVIGTLNADVTAYEG